MQVIFGFGPAHEEKGNKIADQIARCLVARIDEVLETEDSYKAAGVVRTILEEVEFPTFKFKESTYKTTFVHFPSVQGEKGDYLIVAGFDVSHYRDDHPMSSDGFACMTQKFTVVVNAHIKRFEVDDPLVEWFLHYGALEKEKPS